MDRRQARVAHGDSALFLRPPRRRIVGFQGTIYMTKLLIGVLAARCHESRRRGVVNTWGRDVSVNSDIDLVFLIGDPSLQMPRRADNILYVPCPDNYDSLP